MADNFFYFAFGRVGLNMWTSDKPIKKPSAGYDNSDIPTVGYKTYRNYWYRESELEHLERSLDTGWDPIPNRLLKLWSKRG